MQSSLKTPVPNVDKWGCFESREQPWAEWYNLDMFVYDCICRLQQYFENTTCKKTFNNEELKNIESSEQFNTSKHM